MNRYTLNMSICRGGEKRKIGKRKRNSYGTDGMFCSYGLNTSLVIIYTSIVARAKKIMCILIGVE